MKSLILLGALVAIVQPARADEDITDQMPRVERGQMKNEGPPPAQPQSPRLELDAPGGWKVRPGLNGESQPGEARGGVTGEKTF